MAQRAPATTQIKRRTLLATISTENRALDGPRPITRNRRRSTGRGEPLTGGAVSERQTGFGAPGVAVGKTRTLGLAGVLLQ